MFSLHYAVVLVLRASPPGEAAFINVCFDDASGCGGGGGGDNHDNAAVGGCYYCITTHCWIPLFL